MKTDKKTLSDWLTGSRLVFSLRLAGFALVGWIWLAAPSASHADEGTNAPPKSVASSAPGKPDQADKTAAVKRAKKVSGVELYAIHCNRCHPERYPVEFNEAQWKTLMLHMRVRANLPADQAEAVLKYLQDEAGY
jgi:hypothetical protein